MNRGSEVLVIGAGIIGASIAHQLASRGVSVVAVDKGRGPAEGSTGASSSISRCRYTHPEVVRLAFNGQQAYGNWGDFTGLTETRSELQRVGVLWLMGESSETVDAAVEKLTREGVGALNLRPDDVDGRFPAVSNCVAPFDMTGEIDHVCAPGEAYLFETEGGYTDPVGANQDLVQAVRDRGGVVRFGERVSEILTTGGTVNGVRLASGEDLRADLVVNAAGPWCNEINGLAEVALKWTLTPTRIQTVYRPWPSELGSLPVGADSSTGIYFRPESAGQQVLVGSVLAEDEEEIVDDPDDFKRLPDAEFTQMKLAAFHHRIPSLEARGEISGIAGLYTVNREDVHPVVGPTGRDGFWVANGFSGHGFKLAPAIGSMIAQAITGITGEFDTDVPMSFFAVDREPIAVATKCVLA